MTAERAVALSMFPEIMPDRPVGPIVPSVFVGSNADLISAVSSLYLQGSVADLTYGEGNWWKTYRPAGLVAHDKYKGDGVDFTALPEPDGTYDAVCFDPPYITKGGATVMATDRLHGRYGIAERSSDGLRATNNAGMTEGARVLKPGGFLLMKCSDFVDSHKLQLGHRWALDHADTIGLICHDLIVHHTGSGPGGHNIFTPKRARRHHSYLLVFVKPTSRTRPRNVTSSAQEDWIQP